MSTHPPDPPPIVEPSRWQAGYRAAADTARLQPWAGRLAATFGTLALLLLLLLLIALLVPPMLDWSRYRNAVAAIASAQLQRPVRIAGEVTLRLLPEAVLTATDVTLPEQGDGVSATLAALRLQVGLVPLLAGRIVPRDLVLGAPILRVPWPLPPSVTHPARPRIPHAFAVHVEAGTLRIGGGRGTGGGKETGGGVREAQVTGINASLRSFSDPLAPAEAGLLHDPGTLAFGAEGFAAFGGRSWRFTTALGAPDADGVSGLDLGLTGQGEAGRTGARIQGSLAEGVIQGRLVAGGPDLSLLMPAARLGWHLEAPFVASGEAITAGAITLSLGGAPVDAALSLSLSPPAGLAGRIHAASIDLDGWARAVASGPAPAFRLPHLPGRIDWSLDAATLFGGRLADLHGTIVSDGATLRVEHAAATLPGGAHAGMDGRLDETAQGPSATGPATLDAPDLRATLSWLHRLAPTLIDAVPPPALGQAPLGQAPLGQARLAGTLTLAPDRIEVSGLAGTLDHGAFAGAFTASFAPRQHFDGTLGFDSIDLDSWLPSVHGEAGTSSLAAIGSRVSHFDTVLHVQSARATWRGMALDGMAFDAETGSAGLLLSRASARLGGAQLAVQGALAPDGAITDGAISLSAADVAPLLAALPASWRHLPGLWRGPGALQAKLAGPPSALAVTLRADMDDLILEAEGQADIQALGGEGTLTLRHPGAPRLLADLGLPGAQGWLDTGSFAVRATIAAAAGRITAQDFDLVAADMRLGGNLALDLSTPDLPKAVPRLTGRLSADMLALPGPAWLAGHLPAGWADGWSCAIDLAAAAATLDRRPLATGITAYAGLAQGDGLIDVGRAAIDGGTFRGQIALQSAASGMTQSAASGMTLAARGHLEGAHIAEPFTGLPVDLVGGGYDADLELGSSDGQWRMASGNARLVLRDGSLSGFDLAAVGHALSHPASRAALAGALTHGTTSGLDGVIDLAVSKGSLHVGPSTLAGTDMAVTIQGSAALEAGTVDLTFAGPRAAAVRVSGTFRDARATAILPPAAAGRAGVAGPGKRHH